jgi:hypothetical protein
MSRYALLFLVLLTLPVRANLGDTIAQCVTRYGTPDHFSEASPKNPFGTLIFTQGGYGLIVFLLNNVEVGARVSKKDNSAFTDAELQTIMGADSSAAPWTSTASPDPSCQAWTRADKASVLYDKTKHMVIFTAPEMAAALKSK